MPRNLIKKYLPRPDTIIKNRWIKLLGPRLQDPGLWHINRRSFSGGLAVGMFFCFMPVPFQMLLAAVAAIIMRYNIMIAVPTVWISNPVTMPPMFYFCYIVGAEMLNTEIGTFNFELTFDWLLNGLNEIWQPFLLGCLVVAITTSILSYITVRILWRYHVWNHIKIRKSRRKSRNANK